MSHEKDFLLYIKLLKELTKNNENQSLTCLAEEWTYKLLLEKEKPEMRNYVFHYVVQQFHDNNFKSWFNKENLNCSIEEIAKEIHSDSISQHPGDTKSLGRTKLEQIQKWIEDVDGNKSFDDEVFYMKTDDETKCLYSNTNQQSDDTLSFISTSNFTENELLLLYQKFISEHLPLLIAHSTNSSTVPSFDCDEKYEQEFFKYEENIIEQLTGLHQKKSKLNEQIEQQKSQIGELERQTNQALVEKHDKCIETGEDIYQLDTHFKEQCRILTPKCAQHKNNTDQYMRNVNKNSMAIKDVLERSKFQLVKETNEEAKINEEIDIVSKP